MNRITTIILVSALAAGAHITHAADASSRRQVQVRFSDLDLSSIAGATTLYRRLRSAAESVCTESGSRDLKSVFRVKTCVSAAMSAAVTDVNQPALTAYYRAKQGTTTVALRQASR